MRCLPTLAAYPHYKPYGMVSRMERARSMQKVTLISPIRAPMYAPAPFRSNHQWVAFLFIYPRLGGQASK